MGSTARGLTWNTWPDPEQMPASWPSSIWVVSEPQGKQASEESWGDREQAVGQDRAYLWSDKAQEVGLILSSRELWVPRSFPSGPTWIPDCCLPHEGPSDQPVSPEHVLSERVLFPHA